MHMINDNYSYDSEEVTKLLISLYYHTDNKYYMSRNKIQELLIIYQLWCIKYNRIGILPSAAGSINVNNNSMSLNRMMDYDLALVLENLNKKNTMSQNRCIILDSININDKTKVPPLYLIDVKKMSEDLINLIILIFRTFGNWNERDLNFELKKILNYLQLIGNYELNSLDVTLKNKMWENNDNEIIKFINKNKPKMCAATITKNIVNNENTLKEIIEKYNNMDFEDKVEFLKYLGIIKDEENNVSFQKVKK